MSLSSGLRVAVFPPWSGHLGNRILTPGDHCTVADSFAAWRARAADVGFQIDTHDICPPAQADILWFVDLPVRRRDFAAAVDAARPGTKLVLHQLESPLYADAAHQPANQARFDRVLTYNPKIAATSTRHRLCRIPYAFTRTSPGLPFAARRVAVMVNTNKVVGWTERRGRGHGRTARPGIGRFLTGWKLPWQRWFNPCPGDLLPWRRRLARAADRMPDPVLDVFGQYWRGERIHWWRYPRPRPYRCALEAPGGDTLPDLSQGHAPKLGLLPRYRFTIASENQFGDYGYVSEKLFDALQAGTVPVYLGDKHITELLPAEAFIDAREFRSPRRLLEHLSRMPESEWTRRRAAGQTWLQSPDAQSFGTEKFVETAIQVLHELNPAHSLP